MKRRIFLISLITSLSLYTFGDDQDFSIQEEMFNCFKIDEIRINLEYEDIQWSPREKFSRVCSFSFHIISHNIYYQYLTRRWRSPSYCKKFFVEWENLKKEKSKICIAAYLSYPEKDKYQGKEVFVQSGFWEEIKSGNWCHTYFSGNCRGIERRTESY
jgi:hypothetical protein